MEQQQLFNKLICCNRSYLSGHSYYDHLKNKNFKSGKVIGENDYYCVLCSNKPYKYLSSLKNHLNTYHLNFLKENLKFNDSPNQNEVDPSNEFQDYETEQDFYYSEIEASSSIVNNQIEVSTFEAPNLEFPATLNKSQINDKSFPIESRFSLLLQSTMVENRMTEVASRNLSSKTLFFLKYNDLIKNEKVVNKLIKVSKSLFLQSKSLKLIYDAENMIKKVTEYGGEFYFIDFKKTIEFVMSNNEIVKHIFEDKFCK